MSARVSRSFTALAYRVPGTAADQAGDHPEGPRRKPASDVSAVALAKPEAVVRSNSAARAGASLPCMSKGIVLSLGRVVADKVRIDAAEVYAVLQQVCHRMHATRDNDGGVIACPPLDAMGITPFGDVEWRSTALTGGRSVRPPHQVTRELGRLLGRLLASGDPDLAAAPAACVDAFRRATATGPLPRGLRPIVTPEALLRAIEAFRPRDGSGALAALYGRWLRTTDSGQIDAGATTPVAPRRHEELGDLPLHSSVATPTTVSAVRRAAPPRTVAATPVARAAVAPRADTRPGPTLLIAETTSARVSWPRAAVVALACIVLFGTAGWRWMREFPQTPVAERASAKSAQLRTEPTPRPEPQPPGYTEMEVGTPAPPSGAPPAPARVRRVLDAARTGQAPYSPSFDPRTHVLVFHAGRERTALLQASLRSDGSVEDVSTVRKDGSSNYHAQVSPDGERLAFDSDVDGTRGVYVANRDGSSPKRVSGPGYASVPTWSPDGQRLAFARAEDGRPRIWNIWTVNVATGTLRRITSHRVGQPWGASWFPDGQRIVYSLEDRLIVRDLDTGSGRSYPTPVRGRLLRTPAVSPDGQRIVFQVHRHGAWVLDLRTGRPYCLIADPTAQEFAWSPDGRQVAYHSVRGGGWGIWMADLEPGP
jgi:hypothetical protein